MMGYKEPVAERPDPDWWVGIHPQASIKPYIVTYDIGVGGVSPEWRARKFCWTLWGARIVRRHWQDAADNRNLRRADCGLPILPAPRPWIVDRRTDPRSKTKLTS